MRNRKVNTIQDNVLRACKQQVEDDNKSDLLSTYHTHKHMEDEGFNISRQQVQSAFYALTEKGKLYKDSQTIWKLKI